MEMTRRGFLCRVAGVVSAICAAAGWIGRKAVPRRVVRADRPAAYPGTVVPMGDIRIQSKWSG